MPLFDFRCTACGTTFEALCKDRNAPGAACPECGGASAVRLISTFSVSRQLAPCGAAKSDAVRACGADRVRGGCGGCQVPR